MSNTGYPADDRGDMSDLEPRHSDTDAGVSQLNSFLRGEISAAETYRMAIDKVADSDDLDAEVREVKAPLPGVDQSRYRAAEAPASSFSSDTPTAWDEEPKEHE